MANKQVQPGLLFGLLLLLVPSLHFAQSLRVSPDTTAVLGGVTVADKEIAEDDLTGGVILGNIGPLPDGTDLTAYHLLANGDQLLAFDTTLVVGGVTVEPADVVRFDGTGYTLAFDASAAGVPSGTYVDALTHDGVDLVLSFDTTLNLGGVIYDDADLIRFDGVEFFLYFDSIGAGVPDGTDIDAAHLMADGTLLISFDTSGSLGGVVFDDEDVLGFDPLTNTWSLIYDGSAQHGGWAATDLNAISEGEDLGGGSCTPAPDPDLNDDGIVNILDISLVGSCFGQDPSTVSACALADTNCDGIVDYIDLYFVIGGFGQVF